MAIKLPKIQVKWTTHPRASSLRSEDRIPILLIDDRIVDIYAKNGQRPKYIAKDYVIKIDGARNITKGSSNGNGDYAQSIMEATLWKKLRPEDRKYFPRLLRANQRDRWTAQAFVELTTAGITSKHYDVVLKLATRYKLTDIGIAYLHNWALNAKTGEPVIYDYGV